MTLNYLEDKIQLTNMESNILKILIINEGQVMNRKILIKKLWKSDSFYKFRSIDVHISKLRKILKKDDSIKIRSIRGEGYKLLISEK